MTQGRKLPIKRYGYTLIVRPAARFATVFALFAGAAVAYGFLSKGNSLVFDVRLCVTLGLGVVIATITFFSQMSTADWRGRKQLIDPVSRDCFLLWSIMLLIASLVAWSVMQRFFVLYGFMCAGGACAVIYKFLSFTWPHAESGKMLLWGKRTESKNH